MSIFSHPGTMTDSHAQPTTIALMSSISSLAEVMKPTFSSAPWDSVGESMQGNGKLSYKQPCI